MFAIVLAALTMTTPTTLDDTDARLSWFRKARIGMFIHWGPVSLKGTEIGWSRGAQVPSAEYDQLYLRFNPTKFDADAWMKLAKDAGMKYVVPTAKHHDGFCIWPTKQTSHNIANSPFKRDIMGEIAGAAKKEGIEMCSYFSILDWWHHDYGTGSPGGKTQKANPNMDAYMTYLKAQLTEIVKDYKLRMLWFDGQWEAPYTEAMAKDLREFLFKLKPDLVVNNRVGKKSSDGDYDTPEQTIGSFQRGRAWETCMTLCQQWAWKPNDKLKSLDEVIRIVVQTVTGDGNLLLNVGPTPEGEIEARQAERLRELGAWLRKYGQSIYGTRGGPYMNGKWGGATCNGKTVYLHLLDWDGQSIQFKPLPAKVLRFRSLSGERIHVEQSDNGLKVTGPQGGKLPLDTIVRLDLDRDALSIPPISNPLISANGS
ncbi:MAG: alpha-L-fucosidase [Fimbriimonadaceae bacterium]|nr:alpha-L-fucosidase [Fimbriimonadaceae bacterium]